MDRRRSRPNVLVLAWTPIGGRPPELAAAFGGTSRCFYDLGGSAKLTPLRYLVSALRTVAVLLALRPRAVIASAPPVFPGAIAWLYGRLTGAVVVLDTHPQALGVDPTRAIALFMGLQRWLVPRVAACLVAVDELAERVTAWGGRAIVLHEAPPLWEVAPAGPISGRPRVLFIGIFAPDEPFDAVVDAAALVPEADVHVTGDHRRCPPELARRAPANVTFTGFLGPEDFRDALQAADIVMTLTTRETAVNRAAYEAVAAQRPLIISDRPVGRELFVEAIPVDNEPEAIAAGVREAVARHGELVALAPRALRRQRERWRAQEAALAAVLSEGTR